MSSVREYLEAKAETPNEWLRRDPRTTHPEILSLVRDFQHAGGTYDDDAERYVAEKVGDLPPHLSHSHESRDPLTNQLGHEIYIAKGICADDEARGKTVRHLFDGYTRGPDGLEAGKRYLVRFGTVYVGRSEPEWGPAKELRVVVSPQHGIVLLAPRARVNGYRPSAQMLIREVTPAKG